nr:JmjC domain-containing protein [Tanacetum cinerariifolium]
MKSNWDGPHMPLLAPMLVVPAGGDAAGAAANVAAGPGPSSAPQVPPEREHSPVIEHSHVREPSPMREPTPVREPSPRPEPEPTPDSPNPLSPPPSSAEVSPATSSRPPSPSRPPSGPVDIRKGGGDFASPAAMAAGGAEDFAALTALTLKLDECLHRVTTLENELGITKKVLGGAILKLVTRVKRLEGLLQQRKRRLVLSDSEGEDATTLEQEFNLAALHTLASATLGDDPSATAAHPDVETTMPSERTSTTRRRLRKPFTYSVSAHVSETIPLGVRVPTAAATIPTGSSVDAAVHAAATPSSSIPTATDKGKALMVDNSPPTDLLSEYERVLKNLHDSQLGEELAKKIQAEQEAEFGRQQEELAQKGQAESVASPTAHGQGMSDQRRRELDAAQLIYSEADWLDLLAKIATNSALSKKLLGDDVTEENMNERFGMLLMRKRRELAEQSRVKPMTKTQQRDYMRDFVKNCSASVYNQGWTMKKPTLDAPPAKRVNQEAPQVPAVSIQDPAALSIPADASLPTASLSDPAAILVPAVSIAHAAVSVPAEPLVHSAASHMDDPLTAPEHGSPEPTVAAPTPSSSCHRRKHIAKKRVSPIVDVADAEMVPSPLGFVHAYHNIAGHTKHFTTLRKILHMVERTDLQRLLGAVDALYQSEEPDTWMGNPYVCRCLLSSLCRYFGAHVETWIGGFSCWFSITLQMVFSSPWFTAKKELTHHKGTALLVLEQTALVKDKSNPLIVGSLLKITWSPIHHFLTNKVLTSPEQTTTGKDVSNPLMDVMVCQKPLGYFSSPMIHVPRAELVFNPPGYVVPAGSEHSHSCCCVLAGKHSFCCQ